MSAPKRRKITHDITTLTRNNNVHIIRELTKLEKVYKAIGDKWREYSYKKAIGKLRNYPIEIKTVDEAKKLANEKCGIGVKTVAKIIEIITRGYCEKAYTYEQKTDERITTLQLFTNIQGVGTSIATEWYALGLRSLFDLRENKSIKLTAAQKLGILYYEDQQKPIPWQEGKNIITLVKQVAREIIPDCIVMGCGSFRRAKDFSSDCDIIISYPISSPVNSTFVTVKPVKPTKREKETKKLENIDCYEFLTTLLSRLRSLQFLTGDLQISSFEKGKDRATYSGYCKLSLDHFCLINLQHSFNLRHELKTEISGINRRIDLKIYNSVYFPFALLYFTGSALFNRRLRFLARKKGFTLSDHGLCPAIHVKGKKIWQGKSLECKSEEEIFAALDLDFVAPPERSL